MYHNIKVACLQMRKMFSRKSNIKKPTRHDQCTVLKHKHKITHLPMNRTYENRANPQK
jgi:alpha-D-ribose 1-methylphosphonate 5-phosphate C-P lyase